MELGNRYTLDKSAGGRTEVRRTFDARTLGYVMEHPTGFLAYDSVWIPFRNPFDTESEAIGAILDLTGAGPPI